MVSGSLWSRLDPESRDEWFVFAVEGGFGSVDPPGCSLATATLMKAVAPLATTMMALVSRVMRAYALALALGEYWPRPRLTANH